jgi:hypothetical protein
MDNAKIQAMIDELQSMLTTETTVTEGAEISTPEEVENTGVEQKNTEVVETHIEPVDPQTNGTKDDVTPKVDATFEEPTNAQETQGTQEDNGTNYDQMFASYDKRLLEQAMEIDKLKLFCSEIGTRLELVSEITDKVVTVDHDSLLTDSIKLLV